jgi:pimeloyl-ACP methyl ester carboxylesterase
LLTDCLDAEKRSAWNGRPDFAIVAMRLPRQQVYNSVHPNLASPDDNFVATVLKRHPVGSGIVLFLAATAILNQMLSKRAMYRNPPAGRFITVDGVRVHYLERGSGPPLVLLHGNGSMIQDFQSSGLLDLAAKKYRVIAFDRPGFGHTLRPRSRIWTPVAQAALIRAAMVKIGASDAVVLGHSWGTLVAIAMALRYPKDIKAFVLVSGYYFPTPRADVVAFSAPALPLIGDVLSHTLAPLVGRLMWPFLIRKIFSPKSIPRKFEEFPREMALRPSQLRAAAAESALMIPAARTFEKLYHQLAKPVVIVAGANDRYIESAQSDRLQHRIPGSTLHLIPGNGHMVHQTAMAEIMSAIDAAAANTNALAKMSSVKQ